MLGLIRLDRENKNIVIIGKLEVYFSYETPIAFSNAGGYNYVTSQRFSNTTSRFQNELHEKGFTRIPATVFQERLKKEVRNECDRAKDE